MRVRQFLEADSHAVIQLWRDAGLTRPWNNPMKDIARKSKVQPELFLVAVDPEDGAIVGSVMAGYDGHRGWLNYMAVSPSKQGEGVGRLLVEEAKRLLLALGCCKINLQIRTDNQQAQAFYRSVGFSDDACVSMGLRLEED